jgi:inorganic pyrophosphatase
MLKRPFQEGGKVLMRKDFPEVIPVVVEVPKGSRNKYELDRDSGRIKLDRVLFSAVHYPADYGYVEGTLAEDGDEVDVLVLIEEATFPGCLIEAHPVGMLLMQDEKGIDNKVLAVPMRDPRWGHVGDIRDVPPHLLKEIENFFLTYKRLESKSVESKGWRDSVLAREYLVSRLKHAQR